MRGNKKKRYSRRKCFFFFDKKQLDSLSCITGGSNFVLVALNGEKRNINSRKTILKHRS